MRIVLVSLARRGGMVHFLVELANALAKIVPTRVVLSHAVPDDYIASGIPRSRLRLGGSAISSAVGALSPATWYSLWRALAVDAPDLIHVTGVHAWNPALAAVGKMLGKPLVYTLHDPEEHRGAPLSIRISNWLTSRLADCIIVLTEDGKRRLMEKGVDAQKVHAIPHGAYTFFRRWKRPGVRTRKVILCFGRFEPYKDMQNLVAAFARVHKSSPEWRLLLAGSGELPAFLRGELPPGVEIWNDYVPDEAVAPLMQQAQFVVVPYAEASQSGVIAAAYAFGKPVIATAVGGLCEMVADGKTGMLVPPGSAEALARAMRFLVSHPDRLRSMGKQASDRARKLLSWDRIATMHAELYSTILRDRASS